MGSYCFHWDYNIDTLKSCLLELLESYANYAFLDSNGFYQNDIVNSSPTFSTYELVAGAGCKKSFEANKGWAFEELKAFINTNQSWYFGHLGYDLKNELESLDSSNYDYHGFPDIYGFIPEWVLTVQSSVVRIYTDTEQDAMAIWSELCGLVFTERSSTEDTSNPNIKFQSELSRQAYIDRTQQLIEHIINGDIYEVNFCQSFYSNGISIDPVALYKALMATTPTPFAGLYKFQAGYVISASMERFLSKQGHRLISQPIKGTIQRGNNQEEDQKMASKLKADQKERAENVMIVDLVRNDLAKTAKTGSVNVDELFGIYPFPTVHQMISTVTADKQDAVHGIDALKAAFPMGSMTGAPKVRAMELIEEHEAFKRGIFSGAIGYITPWQDYDFNVVIRSFLYNHRSKTLTLPVGSAITYDADPEREYEECSLKIEKLKRCLNKSPIGLSN